MPAKLAVNIEGKNVILNGFPQMEVLRISSFWLRDHCRCDECLHPETQQRLFDTFSLSKNIRPITAEISECDSVLEIVWESDGHQSRYDIEFLKRLSFGSAQPSDPKDICLWDASILEQVGCPSVPCAEFLSSDKAFLKSLSDLKVWGFLFVEGVQATPEATEQVARRMSYIRETVFGGFWDFTANMEHKDTAYTTFALDPHTDGTYSFDQPGYQMFHCLNFEGEGGDSLLVDGFKIASKIKESEPELYTTMSEVCVPGHYLDYSRGTHLLASRPLFRHNRDGELKQITFNNQDRAPFLLEPEESELFYAGLQMFYSMAKDPAFQLIQRLTPGSVLIFDNWRTLHGRKAYNGVRRLAGAYLNKEDLESRLRVLQIQNQKERL